MKTEGVTKYFLATNIYPIGPSIKGLVHCAMQYPHRGELVGKVK